jgi:hypothetical protein
MGTAMLGKPPAGHEGDALYLTQMSTCCLVGVGGTILGVLTAGLAYVSGWLIRVQGKILIAAIDTAIYASPLLTEQEKRDIIRF